MTDEREQGGLFVYAIAGSLDGPTKIGIAKDPFKRCKELQTGNPHKLRVYAMFPCGFARDFERSARDSLPTCRMEGEWFDLSPAQSWACMFGLLKMRPEYWWEANEDGKIVDLPGYVNEIWP
jgi:hypothetical protein